MSPPGETSLPSVCESTSHTSHVCRRADTLMSAHRLDKDSGFCERNSATSGYILSDCVANRRMFDLKDREHQEQCEVLFVVSTSSSDAKNELTVHQELRQQLLIDNLPINDRIITS